MTSTSLSPLSGGTPQRGLPHRPSVSVIIPTYEGAASLPRALDSVLSQTEPPGQVLVVDDSRTQTIERLVASLADAFLEKGVPIAYLRNPGQRGLPAARNAGIDHAQSEIVVFVDDDVILQPDYLDELVRTYESNHNARGVQGYWGSDERPRIFSFLEDSFGRIFFLWHYSKEGYNVLPSAAATYAKSLAHETPCQWLSGSNMSYRKSVLDEFRFDEKLRHYACGEDVDFSYRVYQRYPDGLFANPRARLFHKATQASAVGSREIVLMQFVYSRYLSYKHFRPTLRNRLVFSWSVLGRILEQLIRDVMARLDGRREFGLGDFKSALDGARLSRRHSKQIRLGDLSFFDAMLAAFAPRE